MNLARGIIKIDLQVSIELRLIAFQDKSEKEGILLYVSRFCLIKMDGKPVEEISAAAVSWWRGNNFGCRLRPDIFLEENMVKHRYSRQDASPRVRLVYGDSLHLLRAEKPKMISPVILGKGESAWPGHPDYPGKGIKNDILILGPFSFYGMS